MPATKNPSAINAANPDPANQYPDQPKTAIPIKIIPKSFILFPIIKVSLKYRPIAGK